METIKTKDMQANNGIESTDSRGNRAQMQQPMLSDVPAAPMVESLVAAELEPISGEAGAKSLLANSPKSYLFNQAYGLWFFLSWFILITLITRKVSTEEYGTLAVILTAYNTILYIVAFGLEDAITTYVPRVFAVHGNASAGLLIRRLLVLRIAMLVVCTVILLFSLPVLANLIALLPVDGAKDVANRLRDQQLLAHMLPITLYVLGSSISSLLSAVCAAYMRMSAVLVIGSITQVALLGVGFLVLQLGFGIDGVLWMLAIVMLVNASAFALWLAPTVFARGKELYKQPLAPVVKLGISAWLTNLVNGALLKQASIILLGYFAVSLTLRGFFNLSFQLADSANALLVAGFGGVGGSALAAAAIGRNYERLGRSWEVLIKVETLLAAPVLVFCLFNAQNIVDVLYTKAFAPVGPLLAIFLFFNILVRVLGTTIHQSTLYVMNKARLVVLGQWIGLATVIVLGIFLIPRYGPAGALIADGIAKALTGCLLLAFLWRDLPSKYPLGFTLRFLLALTIAALPGIVWHPTNRILFGISGVVFLVLCFGLLLLIKPLSNDDLGMIESMRPSAGKYLKWFARGKR
ncbi:MAG: hypothetical protein NVSMB49_13650 [Ktedonobacteraceae bacterium]